MAAENRKVLELLVEGKITIHDADRLLDKLPHLENPGVIPLDRIGAGLHCRICLPDSSSLSSDTSDQTVPRRNVGGTCQRPLF